MRAVTLLIAAGLVVAAGCQSSRKQATPWCAKQWQQFAQRGPVDDALPDFSRAGYKMGEVEIPRNFAVVVDATEAPYDVTPDDGLEDASGIQAAADFVADQGGGVVLLPAGTLDFNVSGDGPVVRIRRSGVVIRGAGADEGGSILHLRRHFQDYRQDGVLFVRGDMTMVPITEFTKTAARGATVIEVQDTVLLSAGQIVRIELTDDAAAMDTSDPSKATLAAELTEPFVLSAEQSATIGSGALPVAWMTRIEEIVDASHVRLAQPLRFDHRLEHHPTIVEYHPVQNVGIENLRIETDWPGQYVHHKPYPPDAVGEDIIRTRDEQDYLWTAIQLNRCADCWVRDVVIKDANQGIVFWESVFDTVERVRFEGQIAHLGLGLSRTHSMLARDITFATRFVHSTLYAVFSSGNVLTDSRTEGVSEYDITAPADHLLDMHGLFPHENLYDDLDGFYVDSGGPSERMPNGGVRNVYWNIRAPERMDAKLPGSDEFFRSFAIHLTTSGEFEQLHELYPSSFAVGVTREAGAKVEVGGLTEDRNGDWITVEGLNRESVQPRSLYEAQVALRNDGADVCAD